MAYCNAKDCEAKITAKELIRLFADKTLPGDPEPDEVDSALFTYAADSAADEIDGYLRRRYAVPLTTVPAAIRDKAVTLTLYRGYERRRAVTQQIQDGYDRAVRWLRDCSNGLVDLGVQPPPPANTTRQIATFGDARVMTDARLKGLL